MSDVILSNVQIWRQKVKDNTITQEELREAVNAIRKERITAGAVSESSRKKKATAKEKAKPIDADALLNQLFA